MIYPKNPKKQIDFSIFDGKKPPESKLKLIIRQQKKKDDSRSSQSPSKSLN